jgi:hypothetical protein
LILGEVQRPLLAGEHNLRHFDPLPDSRLQTSAGAAMPVRLFDNSRPVVV